MLHYKIKKSTSLSVNNAIEGETIEEKIRRITETKEPISDGAEIIYTPRKDGIKPEYDIRTDRFDIALDAMDKVSRTRIARREESLNTEINGVEPIQGTDID